MPAMPDTMTTDDELRSAVDALEESVLVVGAGAVGRTAATRIADRDVPATDSAERPDAVVVAIDAAGFVDDSASTGSESTGSVSNDPESDGFASDGSATDGLAVEYDPSGGTLLTLPAVPDAPVSLAVVTIPARPVEGEREFLDALVHRIDTVVLAAGNGADDLTDAVATLVSIVRDTGVVNVDIADARTVFEAVSLAALCGGTSEAGKPATAVRNAFGSLPSGIETDPAPGVLVDVVVDPQMTVGDVSEAVSTVREYVGPEAHVIWGGAVDEDAGDGFRARLVLAGVKNGRVATGDRCPRCGTPLSTYTLGDRTVPSCEECGFAGVSVRHRE